MTLYEKSAPSSKAAIDSCVATPPLVLHAKDPMYKITFVGLGGILCVSRRKKNADFASVTQAYEDSIK